MIHVGAPVIHTFGLCSGAGMLDEALARALEWHGYRARPVGYCERESGAAATHLARMEEQSVEPAPIWCGSFEDIRTRRFRGMVDGVAGGIPCQPFSQAGKQEGTEDDRWLWPAFWKFTQEVGAWFIAIENVSGFIRAGLEPVLHDLAEAGWSAEWCHLRAAAVGASHARDRIFLIGMADTGIRQFQMQGSGPQGRDGFGPAIPSPLENTPRIDGSAGPGRRGVRQAGAELDNATSPRRDGAGIGPETNSQSGQCLSGARCQDMGNADDGEQGKKPQGDGSSWERARVNGPGKAVEFSESIGNGSGNLPEGIRTKQPEPSTTGEHLANPKCEPISPEQREESWKGSRRRTGASDKPMPGGTGENMAHPSGAGLEERGRESGHIGPLQSTRRPDSSGLCPDGIFAPGPGCDQWPRIITDHPHLAPALEPEVRVLVDGVAYVVDASRADQLRACGNGVVALQAAVAYAVLLGRIIEGKD